MKHLSVNSTLPQRVATRASHAVVDVLILVVAVALAVQGLIFLKGLDTLVVGSGSMSPELKTGDAVMIRPVAATDLKVGDIITYQPKTAERSTTHRIIGIKNIEGSLWFQTKGDANSSADVDLTPAGAVLGRVDSSLARWGYLLQFLDSREGRLVTVVFPLSLLIAEQLLQVFRLMQPASSSAGRRRSDDAPVWLPTNS